MSHDNHPSNWHLQCPVPLTADSKRITLAHGEGGRLMRRLIREHILSPLGNSVIHTMDDAGKIPAIDGPLAMTTDSFVVSPLFFPGGDIGLLSVYGTVNDLAVSGARPLYLTLSLILEEGLPLAILDCVMQSILLAINKTGVQLIAGDTKVVPRGAADGMFINTTGIGQLIDPIPTGPSSLCVGDEILVTGPIGQHGIAVLCAREDFGMTPPPVSDSASLIRPCLLLREKLGTGLRAMRDATRGGVAAVLHEWSEASGQSITIIEKDVPVSSVVRGVCELLGLDPLHVANEGTMVIAVASCVAQQALEILRSIPETANVARIGTVVPRRHSPVTILRTLGPEQPLDDPLGAPLPRIC